MKKIKRKKKMGILSNHIRLLTAGSKDNCDKFAAVLFMMIAYPAVISLYIFNFNLFFK